MSKIAFVVHAEGERDATRLSGLIEQTVLGRVARKTSHEVELKEALSEVKPEALLVELNGNSREVLDLLEQVRTPDLAIYLIGENDDSELLLRALKLGAKEFFPPEPSSLELDAAIEKLFLSLPKAQDRRDAPILAVMGAKGGVGATFVACQLAASLQRRSGSAAIVDLNSPLGDVALQFDLEPRYTLASVLQQPEKCDATFIDQLLEEHKSGLRVLAALERVEEHELIRGDHVDDVLSVLRGEVDWIVLDVARSWNEPSVRALDLASEILLVTSGDLAALAHTRKHVDLLCRLGYSREKIHLVANRYPDANTVSRDELAKFLDGPCDVELPNDYASAIEAINGGQDLADSAPKAALARAYENLADSAYTWCEVEGGKISNPSDGLGTRVRRFFQR
jgi:pilus assembly protein CpaE